MATASLVLGILSVTCVPLLTAIPGVICGHCSLAQIKRSQGTVTGRGMALTGLITGYLGILGFVLLAYVLVPRIKESVVQARAAMTKTDCVKNLRDIDVAKRQWAIERGKKDGDIPTFEDLKPYLKDGLLPSCPGGGAYTIGAIGDNPTCSVTTHKLWPEARTLAARPNLRSVTAPTATPPAQLQRTNGFFIPAAGRWDMAHDAKRNLLYISAGDVVLRYELGSKAFLTPLALGGELRGIDLSADNEFLAVADLSEKNGNIGIHLVDLTSGTDTPVAFVAERNEGGTYSVAFGIDGGVWITSTHHGSGETPLRKFSLTDRHTRMVGRVGKDTALAASANREFIALATSAGYYGRFDCRAKSLPPLLRANTSLSHVGISRDGSQWALPTFGSLVLAGASVPQLSQMGVLDAAYHPLQDYLFFTRGHAPTIAVYETANFTKVKDLELGERLDSDKTLGQGRLHLSSDGKYIFCTVNGGIRCLETGL
ncbi:MAG TPA: DUF4190 domain-containing protein [Verrucomicrobiae bacterium]